MAEPPRVTVDDAVEPTAAAETAAAECSAASQSNSNGSSRRKIKVFLAHSSKNEEWVEETVTRLEAEHDITCIIHQRDFIGGKPVVENILTCIRNADKTVLVLTDDFLNSEWCKYEVQVTLREHLVRERSVILPVMLKDCIVPDFISHLTWLDARQQSFWEKFIKFLESEPVEIALRGSFIGHESALFNGKVISTVRLKGWYNRNSIDYTDVYESLRANGIRINEDVMDRMKMAFRGSGLTRCLCCTQTTSSSICRVCFCTPIVLIIILFILSFILGFYQIVKKGVINADDYFDVLFVIIFFILPVLFIIISVGWILQMEAIERAAENAVNSILMDSKVLFAMLYRSRCTGQKFMCFVYFDIEECQVRVEEYLGRKRNARSRKRTRSEHTTVTIDMDSGQTHDGEMTQLIAGHDNEGKMTQPIAGQDNDEIKIEAKRMLSRMAVEYVKKNDLDRSPCHIGQRHTLHGLCLCQMIENQLRG